MFNAARLSSVSVVIPIFNEAQNLPALLQRTEAAFRQLGLRYEIILVDDGSHDSSAALLCAAAPLRLLSVIGGIIVTAGFCMGLGMLLLRCLLGQIWAGDGLFTLFAFLFTFIGAQLIALALLGEYLGRIYQTLRARPGAVIQQVVGASPAARGEITP